MNWDKPRAFLGLGVLICEMEIKLLPMGRYEDAREMVWHWRAAPSTQLDGCSYLICLQASWPKTSCSQPAILVKRMISFGIYIPSHWTFRKEVNVVR